MSKKNDKNIRPNIDNRALNAILAKYRNDQSKENLMTLMQETRTARHLVPGKFARELNDLELQRLKMGTLPREQHPGVQPILVENQQGDRYVPSFTSQEALDAAPEPYPVILNVDFAEVMRISEQEGLNIKGVMLNPFTDHLVLHPQFLNAVRQMEQNAQENPAAYGEENAKKEVRMTLPEFQIASRRNVEFGMLPKAFFTDGAGLLNRLEEEREQLICEYYRKPYGDSIPCSFQPSDFDVMLLDINEGLSVASIDVPEPTTQELARSIYLFHQKEENRFRYFVIVHRAELDAVIELKEDGTTQVLGEAPARGSELSWLLDQVQNT